MSIEGGTHQSDSNINPSFQPIGSYEELVGFLADMSEARLNLSGEGFALLMKAYWTNVAAYYNFHGMTFEAELFTQGVIEADNELRREQEGELPGVPHPEPPQPLN